MESSDHGVTGLLHSNIVAASAVCVDRLYPVADHHFTSFASADIMKKISLRAKEVIDPDIIISLRT